MIRRLIRSSLVALLALVSVGLVGSPVSAASKSFGERLTEWLNEPGVRVVVVEFYSDYCEPCKEAAPAWERLRKRYEKDGLRLVVINIDDVENVGQCKKLPWQPWKALCKPELAQELGVTTVPQSFIWSWQGNLLMSGQKNHVREAEAVVKRYFQDNPRVIVEAKDTRGRDLKRVQRMVESSLSMFDKVTLVVSDKDRKALRDHQERTFQPDAREDQQCALGGEVSANMLLSAEVYKGSISLTLKQLNSKCMQTVSASYDPRREAASVNKAVFRLMNKLRRKVQIPGEGRDKVAQRGPSQPVRPSFSAGDVTAVKGRLRIEGSPRGAQVEISGPGGWTGQGTVPTTFEDLDPGRYAMTAIASGFIEGSTEATVRADETTVARIKLALPAALDVTGSPAGAKVELYDAAGAQLGKGSFPLRGKGLTPGTYRLKVSRRGYVPYEQQHRLKAGQTMTLKVELQRRNFASDPRLPSPLKAKEKACRAGKMDACFPLARAYRKGLWMEPSPERAAGVLTYACDLGSAAACGRRAEFGLGVAKDLKQAAKFYREACKKGDGRSCSNLGILYRTGKGVTRDRQRARQLYKKACDGGQVVGCFNLGWLYRTGTGVAKDVARAAALYKRACKGGVGRGCTKLGRLYEKGEGVPTSMPRAAAFYGEACDAGVRTGCFYLAAMVAEGAPGVRRNLSKAVKYYGLACEGRFAKGCFNLGQFYDEGRGVSTDKKRARGFYKMACDLGHKEGCFTQSHARERDVEAAKKTAAMRKAAAPSIDEAVVSRVIRRRQSALKSCYAKARREKRNLKGTLTVRFQIGTLGRITRIKTTHSTVGPNVSRFSRCVMSAMKGWRFPKPTGGPVTLDRTWTFKGKKVSMKEVEPSSGGFFVDGSGQFRVERVCKKTLQCVKGTIVEQCQSRYEVLQGRDKLSKAQRRDRALLIKCLQGRDMESSCKSILDCVAPVSDGKPAYPVALAKSLNTKMCACKDLNCLKGLQNDARAMANVTATATDEQKAEVTKLEEGAKACVQKIIATSRLAGAAGAPPMKPGSMPKTSLIKKATALKDKFCACKDQMCVATVSKEANTLKADFMQATDEEKLAMRGLGMEIRKCIQKLMPKPTFKGAASGARQAAAKPALKK